MRTTKNPSNPANVAIVYLGYQYFALPVSDGLKIAEIMSKAQLVEFCSETGLDYKIESEPPKVKVEIIPANRVGISNPKILKLR